MTSFSSTSRCPRSIHIRSAAARLINEQADEVVATLYSDYCTKGVAPKPAAEPKRKK